MVSEENIIDLTSMDTEQIYNLIFHLIQHQSKELIAGGIKGVLLHGSPGVGKTFMIRKIADMLSNAQIINSVGTSTKFRISQYSAAELIDHRVGFSEKFINDIALQIKRENEPSIKLKTFTILIIDDIESIFCTRSKSSRLNSWDLSSLSQFLKVIDDIDSSNAFLLFSSNRIDLLDYAILSRVLVLKIKDLDIGTCKKFIVQRCKELKIDISETDKIYELSKSIFDRYCEERKEQNLQYQTTIENLSMSYRELNKAIMIFYLENKILKNKVTINSIMKEKCTKIESEIVHEIKSILNKLIGIPSIAKNVSSYISELIKHSENAFQTHLISDVDECLIQIYNILERCPKALSISKKTVASAKSTDESNLIICSKAVFSEVNELKTHFENLKLKFSSF